VEEAALVFEIYRGEYTGTVLFMQWSSGESAIDFSGEALLAHRWLG